MHIDWWTLALQTLNVLILVWILGRYFFRPVAAIVTRRQEEADKLLADAEAVRRQAAETRSQVDTELAGLAERRQALIEEAHRQAKTEQANLLAQASRDVERMRAEAVAAAERDRAAAERAVLAHAGELALDIARRLLQRLPPGAAFGAFVDELGRQARRLPPEARDGLKPRPGSDERLEVVAATSLSDAEQQAVRAALSEALGADLAPSFRQDAALLAGLEVHGPTTVLRNSWRADLEAIREEIARERQSQPT